MKPSYHYICPCGYRTDKAWRWSAHYRICKIMMADILTRIKKALSYA